MICRSTGSPAACRPGAPGRRSTAGFTLVEILVSFAIAAIVLGVLYRIYSTGLRSSSGAERYSNAMLLAESTLDELSSVRPADADDVVGPYRRHWTVSPRPDLLPKGTQIHVVPYEVTVTVAWREGTHERNVSLAVLRLAPATP